ncbi:MAG: hypothetical protein V1747_04570 [Candidatus Omnitrophota bacterium]
MKSDTLKQNSHIPIEIDLTNFLDKDRVVLALGAELKANYCILNKQKAYLYSGFNDLKNPEDYNQYKQSIIQQTKRLKLKPQVIAHDLNPLFLSSRLAQELNSSGFKTSRIIPIQHHFAHIAGACASLGLKKQEIIGIACDGTGLGDDSKVWGCEFISYDFKQALRLGHLDYIPLPGGDKAVAEPWRVAAALLYMCYGDKLLELPIPWLKQKKYEIQILGQMIAKGINTPWASSAGRLFDGIAALTGLCLKVSSEAQAAIALEAEASKVIDKQNKTYDYEIKEKSGMFAADIRKMIKGIVQDMENKQTIPDIAAGFHNTFVRILGEIAGKISAKTKAKHIVLGGGVFFNKIILEKLKINLVKQGFCAHQPLPEFLSDAGLSLGQAVLAARGFKSK